MLNLAARLAGATICSAIASLIASFPAEAQSWRVLPFSVTPEYIAEMEKSFGPSSSVWEDIQLMKKGRYYLLVKSSTGTWNIAEEADTKDINVEKVWVNSATRQYSVAAPYRRVCGEHSIDSEQRRLAYTVCTSNFTKSRPTDTHHWVVDAEALSAAVRQAGFFEAYEAEQRIAEAAQRAANAAFEQRERERVASAAAAWQQTLRNAARWRSSIKEGTDTHCGMVIEKRPTIAKVQTLIGEYWFKLEQLFQPGAAPCHFINRVYQEPTAPS